MSSGVMDKSLLNRINAQRNFKRAVKRFKPNLVICCTFEYLIIASRMKKEYGFKLIYDVQENYILNLQLRRGLSKWKRKFWQRLIRKSESVLGIDHFILAEKCYSNQMPEKSPFTLIQNKYVGAIRTILPYKPQEKQGYHFVICGTISEPFGVRDGIRFFEVIQEGFPFSRLSVIGHLSVASFHKEIDEMVGDNPGVELILDKNPIPHQAILDKISKADFVLAPYENHPAFKDKVPSKLFESQALGVPILHSTGLNFESYYEKSRAGFPINFSDSRNFKHQFKRALDHVYFLQPNQLEANWESDKDDFINLVEELID